MKQIIIIIMGGGGGGLIYKEKGITFTNIKQKEMMI